MGYDYSFLDPTTEARVVVRFQARTAGDNRRWSRDLPRPGETPVEARLRELMADPERMAKLEKDRREHFGPLLDRLRPVFEEVKAAAARPATDEDYGRLVRKLATYNEYRLERIEKLLIWWDEVDDGTASESVRDVVARVESALDSITILSPEDLAQME